MRAKQEISVLREVKHPHIVALLEASIAEGLPSEQEMSTVYMLFPWFKVIAGFTSGSKVWFGFICFICSTGIGYPYKTNHQAVFCQGALVFFLCST